ncbi:hypothetical protein F443_06802 [Phytophthora nicotianae P1569]|uniref:Uncharacterized protein n=1 Tax=Phytophthora nicotianae P1569 TaxID=1317065 RepID=V9FFU9_PHYNI|nr:hypothetical protein F443_06802 [Phytophthora nicotianae P1569]
MSASLREMPVSNVTRMHMPRVKSSLAQRDADARVNIRPAHASPSSRVSSTLYRSQSAAVAASSPLSRVTSDRPAIRQQSRPDGDNG